MAKNITIARLNTLVTANAVQFTKELDRASAMAKTKGKGINDALSGIGSALGIGLSVGAVTAFGKSILDLGGQIADLSSVADLNARSFQTISTIAGDSGVSMEEVAKASEMMRMKVQDAASNGADPLNKSLRRLGLTAEGLSALTTSEKWEVLSDRMVHATNKQEAMNIASEIFGAKIGPKLRATFAEIAGGLGKASAGMTGLILSDDQLAKIDEFGDKLGRLGKMAKVFAVNILDGSVGFQKLWEDMKAMAGYKEKIGKNDIRNPGANIIPGGVASMTPEKTQQELLAEKMARAMRRKAVEEDREYKEELDRIAKRKARREADPFNQIKAKRERSSAVSGLMDLYLGDSGTMGGILEDMQKQRSSRGAGSDAPTDAYSRIGLMTGTQVPPEQKKQTGHLKEIEDTLKKIRTLLSTPSLAAYAN